MPTEQIICRACGSVDDYRTYNKGPHIGADCNQCGSFIKFLPQQREPVCYIGKYYGKHFSLITDKSWLEWVIANRPLTNKVLNQFKDRLAQLA